MPTPAAYHPRIPRGLAFDIPEHVAVRAWAEARGLHVSTEIDRVVDGEEYEEVLAVYEAGDRWRRLVLWRAAGAVVLEPRLGRARRFGDIWAAIEAAAEVMHAPPAPTARPARPSRAGRLAG